VPKIVVQRLKNTPAEAEYAIEQAKTKTIDEANEYAAKWWQSNGTISVVVLNGKEIDARYEREWIDRKRVPKAWRSRTIDELEQLQRATVPLETNKAYPSQSDGPLPAAAPTLFKESTKRPKPTASQCGCCLSDRKDHGERDKTPSGRMADHRCLECGAFMIGMSTRQIYDQYMAYQVRLSQDHAKKSKPWSR